MANIRPMRMGSENGLGSGPAGGGSASRSRVRRSAMSFTKTLPRGARTQGSSDAACWTIEGRGRGPPGSRPVGRPDVPLRYEAPERLPPEFPESTQTDTLPHRPHHVKVEEEVVRGQEYRGRDLAREVQVAQI